MSSQDLYLSITPYTPSNIPAEDALIAAGKALIDESRKWKQGKSYCKNTVKTCSRSKTSKDGAGWHARHSVHSPSVGSFEDFWKGLGVKKAEHEREFIPELEKVTLVKELSSYGSIWTLYYKFPPPVSPRVFTVYQLTHLPPSSPGIPKEGYIVSIPIDLSSPGDEALAEKEEKAVRGRYVSVEYIKELEDGGVEWIMATSSTPGGNIPNFVAEHSMPSQISNDVPHYIEWMQKQKAREIMLKA